MYRFFFFKYFHDTKGKKEKGVREWKGRGKGKIKINSFYRFSICYSIKVNVKKKKKEGRRSIDRIS